MQSLLIRALVVIVAILVSGIFVPPLKAYELQIENGKVSVTADRVPLQELLMRVSDYGIAVRIDPELNPITTASFKNKDLQDGLKSLITPLNSAFIWREATSRKKRLADGPLYDLAEIQIFKPGRRERMVFLDKDEDNESTQSPLETLTPPGIYQTKVTIKANRVFVPVILTHENRTMEVSLIFDTGAGNIVLHQDVADNLGLFDVTRAKGRGVGGIEIDAKVGRLESVKVGPYEKQNLRVAIVRYQGEQDERYHGLLGMNFLRGLKYEIDFENQMIRWGAENADEAVAEVLTPAE